MIEFSTGEIAAYYANRTPKLKRVAAQLRGPCPVHGGQDDNFTVNPKTGAAFCHSKCGRGWDIPSLEMELTGADFRTAKEEVFQIVGRIEPYDHHGAPANGTSKHTPPPKLSGTGGWVEIARYRYVDAVNTLLYEVIRYRTPDGKKTFIPVRPSGVEAAGTGGLPIGGIVIGLNAGDYVPDPVAARRHGKPTWKCAKESRSPDCIRLRDCQRVPYRLTGLLAADLIYLPEGEKDVDTMEELGLVASCNPGGAGKFTSEMAVHFAGKHVIILPDNDEPGRRHAGEEAAALLSVAASVRIVELPDLPDKGDVTDWRDAGGTFERFQKLVDVSTPVDAAALGALRERWGLVDDKPNPHSKRAEEADEWPVPMPLHGELPPVLPFSEAFLPEAFRRWAADIAERMQVAIDFAAIVVVLCLAGIVNRRVVIQPKANDSGWVVVPNLWGGIIAPPGYMKSPVIQAGTRPLTSIQTAWRIEYEAALKEYQIAFEDWELQKSAWKQVSTQKYKKGQSPPERPLDQPPPPVLRRLVVNDATPEKLHVLMNENPAGILVIRDELTGWLSSLGREGREGERAFCLECWNGDGSYTIDRIGRGTIHVAACCMSMLGGIQPGRLRSYLNDALEDGPDNDGLMQRFQLLVWPDTSPDWVYVDRPPDTAAEELAAVILRRLVELDPEKQILFRFAPDARDLFIEYLSELESKVRGGELHPALISHLSKYRKLMPTLALLFELADQASSDGFDGSCLADSSKFVTLESTRRAASMCEYLESHARRIYSCVITPQLRAACELADKIKKKKVGAEGSFSCREVYVNGWSGLETPEAARQAAEVLVDAKWIWEVPAASGPTGGRPPNRYRVNPRVWQ